MVRTYQKKNLTRKWSEDNMKAAIEAVKMGDYLCLRQQRTSVSSGKRCDVV